MTCIHPNAPRPRVPGRGPARLPSVAGASACAAGAAVLASNPQSWRGNHGPYAHAGAFACLPAWLRCVKPPIGTRGAPRVSAHQAGWWGGMTAAAGLTISRRQGVAWPASGVPARHKTRLGLKRRPSRVAALPRRAHAAAGRPRHQPQSPTSRRLLNDTAPNAAPEADSAAPASQHIRARRSGPTAVPGIIFSQRRPGPPPKQSPEAHGRRQSARVSLAFCAITSFPSSCFPRGDG